MWQHQISHEKLFPRVNLQLLWVFNSVIGNLWPYWTPIWCPGCLQKGSKILTCPKLVTRSYMSVQVSSFWVSFLEIWAIFDLFVPSSSSYWPLICPKTGQNICFDNNQTPRAKLCIYVKFYLLVIILLEMVNFDPAFDLLLTSPGARKWHSHGKLF